MDKLFQGLLIIGFLFFLNKRRLIWVSPFPVKLQGRLTCFFTKLFWQDLRDAGIFNDNDPLQVWVCKGSEVDVHGLRNRESGFSRCKLIRHDDSETIKTKLDLRKYYSENIRMPCCSFPFHYFFFFDLLRFQGLPSILLLRIAAERVAQSGTSLEHT